jgi:polygalacturonase
MLINKKTAKCYLTVGVFLMSLLTGLSSALAQQNMPSVSGILKNITAPVFKDVIYNVIAYGAIADGKTDSKTAFDKAISLCSTSGGGMVEIPAGKFFIAGPVVLKSHVNLHFDDGAN